MNRDSISNETRLTRVQALVVEILNDLLRAPIELSDETIRSAIARIGAWCRRDRSYVFVKRGTELFNTHEWCTHGIDPAIDDLQGLPWVEYGPLVEPLERGLPTHIPDVGALPEGSASRAILEAQNIRSMLLVPMRHEGEVFGFIGFDGVEATHAFLPGELYLLQSVADVICTVLTRREREQAVAQAQAELAAERSFLASILATSAMGIMVIDEGGVIRFVNDAACRVTRSRRDTLIGARHDDPRWAVTHADGSPIAAEDLPFNQVLATGRPVSGFRMRQPFRGKHGYMSVHAAPLKGGGQYDARVVYAVLDVSEQVQAEQVREEALDEARRASATKSNFLAKMSHEMRTPLNGVLGIAEVLERRVADPEVKRLVQVLGESGRLLLGIINDLLDMTKIEADKLEIETLPFSVIELGQRIEAVHTLKAADRNLSFGVQLLGDGDSLRLGDPFRIMQILNNLIGNAIKFTEIGEVSVVIDCTSAEALTLQVRDTGIGMTEAEMQHAFEDFGQADSSISRRFGGTGLGMSIVRGLVGKMDGSIALDSRPGAGTSITVRLPIVLAAQGSTEAAQADGTGGALALSDAAASGGQAGEPDSFASNATGPLRVLAADDNRTNRMILETMLGQLGISPTMAADGYAALRLIESQPFDLVILDISMPGLDGLSVMRELRARFRRGLLPMQEGRRRPPHVVAFTANAMSHQVETYLQAGFDACLTKPLRMSVLEQALRDAIDARDDDRSMAGIDTGTREAGTGEVGTGEAGTESETETEAGIKIAASGIAAR